MIVMMLVLSIELNPDVESFSVIFIIISHHV